MSAWASSKHKRELIEFALEEAYKTKVDRDRLVELDKLKTEFIACSDDARACAILRALELEAQALQLAFASSDGARTCVRLRALELEAVASLACCRVDAWLDRGSVDAADYAATTKVEERSSSVTRHADIFCQASEFGTAPSNKDPQIPSHIVGIFSCHGIEPGSHPYRTVSKINQDRGSFSHPFADDANQALFCVFDGHGVYGDVVSQAVMLEMPKRLATALRERDDPSVALEKIFIEIEDELPELVGSTACQNSGTTGVVVLLRRAHCWVAHVGDSRAVVGPSWPSWLSARELSSDHKPDDPTERTRIIAAGGFVGPAQGPGISARVSTHLDAATTRGGLAMSRSVGDRCIKGCGIAKPTVSEFDLIEDDSFLVLASDGVCVRDRSVVFRSVLRATVVVLPLLCRSASGGTPNPVSCRSPGTSSSRRRRWLISWERRCTQNRQPRPHARR